MPALEMSVPVKLRFRNMTMIRRVLAADLTGTGQGPVRAAMKQWAVRYRGFIQRRFNSFSRGGGDWPPLALSTIKARRKGKGQKVRTVRSKSGKARVVKARKGAKATYLARDTKRGGTLVPVSGSYSILRDTNTMYNALSPTFEGRPGALEQDIPFGIRVGFGGPARHPKARRASIAELAAIHNSGGGHVPRRRIIVPPDGATLRRMADDMQRALGKLATLEQQSAGT